MAEAENKDPSMDEILQSIKRIISEEDTAASATPDTPAEEDVLELTELVHDDGSVESVKGASEGDLLDSIDREIDTMTHPSPEPQKPIELEAIDRPPEPEPEPPAMPPPAEEKFEESLVSEVVASAAAAKISEFRDRVSASDERPSIASPHFRSGETVEDLVIEFLKPMLKEWLDLHMTDIVERVVEREVRRISGR